MGLQVDKASGSKLWLLEKVLLQVQGYNIVNIDSTTVSFGLLNIRSLTNKGPLIQDLIMDHKFDFLCLSESWQQLNDLSQVNTSTPLGYVYLAKPHDSSHGGGLALAYREKWKRLPLSVTVFSSFE